MADIIKTIDSLNFGDTKGIFTLPYGSCSTAAGTAAKTVAVDNFSLEAGARVAVKFTVTNTAANPTLNVKSTGAKPIYYNGAAITAGYLKANKTYEFVYNGTQWDLIGDVDTDTNTTYTFDTGDANGQIKVTPSSGSAQNVSVKGLGSAAYTNSTAYATAAQGTKADNALPKSGGTLTGDVTLPNLQSIKTSVAGTANTNPQYVATFNSNDSAKGLSYSTVEDLSKNLSIPFPYRIASYQASGAGSLTDPNNGTETGFYYVKGTTNRPPFSQSANDDYRILVTAYNSTWLQQIATDFRCDDIFYRRKENNVWKPWIKIYPTASATSTALGTVKLSDATNSTSTTSSGIAATPAAVKAAYDLAASKEVNQNAFSNIKVGSTTIAADSKTDTLTLAAGSNVTITPDATNDKVTIASSHPTISKDTDTTSSVDPEHSQTFTTIDSITRDTNGHVTKINTKTISLPDAGLHYIPSSDFTTIAGSSTSGSYLATKWHVPNVDGITTPTDGMSVALRVPLAGSSGGILLSINGGTTYYPIVRNVNSLITTHYSVGSTLMLTFNPTQTASPYTTSGTTTTVTGCWQIADYDSTDKKSSGTSNKTGTKMYIVGGTSQSSSGVTTYSNSKCYIGTDNCLYSNGKKVLAAESHASTATTYGIGTSSNYGHVKLSDSTSSTSAASAGIAASPKAVKEAYDLANSSIKLATSDETISLPSAIYWSAITYGNGKFVAMADSSNKVAYSEDGITWNESTLPSTGIWYALAYGNGKFVAVNYDHHDVIYSYDGINWYTTSLASTNNCWSSIAYGNGKFVVVSDGYSVANYSEDGINWNSTTLVNGIMPSSLVYGNGKFVGVDYYGYALYSEDGITWNESTFPLSAAYTLTYGNGKFVAITTNGTAAAYSEDGITWNTITLPGNDDSVGYISLTYGNGKFVIISSGTTTKSAYSYDGVTWYSSNLLDTMMSYVTYGNGKFVAISSGYTTTNYSYDGITWYNKELKIVQNDTNITQSISNLVAENHTHEYPNEVFIATYGTTTYAEILEAYNTGKIVFLRDPDLDGSFASLVKYTNAVVVFSLIEGTKKMNVYSIYNDGTQSKSNVTLLTSTNGVLANGGNNADLTISQARNIYAGTTDMTAGTSTLTTGHIYLVYE